MTADERKEDLGPDARSQQEQLRSAVNELDDAQAAELTSAVKNLRGRPVLSGGPIIRTLEALNALWLLAIAGLLVLALIISNQAVHKINTGRAQAIQLTCAILSGVSTAGRTVLATVPPDTPFIKHLEKAGYPPRPVRVAQAKKTAAAYLSTLIAAAAQVTGHSAAGLVNASGHIDCVKYAQLAGTRP